MRVTTPDLQCGEKRRGSLCSSSLFRAAVCVAMALTFSAEAVAQFHHGWRHRTAVVVAPPIIPSPYYGVPWGPPPIIAPPSTVSVHTPFFSLNVDPIGVYPSRHAYSLHYESYRPRFYSQFEYPSYRYGVVPATEPVIEPSGAYGQYRPGPGGGLPELSRSVAFSPTELRRSAETLRDTLMRRRDDGQDWLDYLQPDTIIADLVEGSPSQSIDELLKRYDGVVRNPKLTLITRLSGFQRTHEQLAAWVALKQAEQSRGIQLEPPSGLPSPPPVTPDSSSETPVPAPQTDDGNDPPPPLPEDVDAQADGGDRAVRGAQAIEELPTPTPAPLTAFENL